jgi:hypothetical protein
MRVPLLLALAGCLPPDTPAAPKPVVDPEVAELVHGWKVTAHVIGTKTSMSEQDAVAMHGRIVEVRAAGYTTPWHGTCEQANREKQQSSLVEITADVDVSPDGRARLKEFGLAKEVTEYRMGCTNAKVPPLTIYLTGKRGMTCFGGVCYLLER